METKSHFRSVRHAGPLPSDATAFARALLGKPLPTVPTPQANAGAEREHLEWLAAISPQFHVHWTDAPTHSTRGGPGGSKTGEKLGIYLDKNHPNYVANPKEVELDGVDPDKAAKIVVGHELGHAMLELQDPSKQNPSGGNVTLVENRLRKRLGVRQREKYNGLHVPSPLGPKNEDLLKVKSCWRHLSSA